MTTENGHREHVVIIGAGAAGLMAAGSIQCCDITVLDGNEKTGKKLYISGKGRCNLTNDCAPNEFLSNVVTNPKFLFSSIYGFTPADTKELFDSLGVPTKTERGNRVFPVSDKSSDVIRALTERAKHNGAKFILNECVTDVKCKDNGFTVYTDRNTYDCDKLLIATGGTSYPATGSTGDGYKFAKKSGHSVVTPVPSLTPLKTKQDVSSLAGLALKNVTATIKAANREFSQFGELLFTHNGVSGPTVLRLSAYINRLKLPLKLYIDMKPALDNETLDKRILHDFAAYANKQLKNSLNGLLPKALIPWVIAQSGIDPDKKVNTVTKEERSNLIFALKNLYFDVTGIESFDSAIVTSGGIDVKDVNPKTMESKIVKNLYFAGEVLDIDALTGGFNIQIAFSTAVAAAKAMSGSK